VHAAVLIAQVRVHLFAQQYGDGARFLAQLHGIKCDEPIEMCKAIKESQAYGAAVEATDAFVVVLPGKSLQRMDASAIVREEAVSDAHDCY
jgi:hypothetical protein